MAKLVQIISATLALTWIVHGAARAGDTAAATCPPSGEPAATAETPRLFERSVEPGNDRTPKLLRATGELAMKALAAPGQVAQWVRERSAERARSTLD